MAETKKSESRRIIDVSHPDKTPATDTSKPVLVNNRSVLKDPMVVDDDIKEVPTAKSSSGNTIEPLTAPELDSAKNEPAEDPKPKESKESKETKAKAEQTKTIAELAADAKAKETTEVKESKPKSEPEPDTPEGKTEEQTNKDQLDEAEKQAQQAAELQELADSKKYFLPINSVEKRRSKRVVVFGVLLSLVLIVAWADIALDAGLIELGGVKSVTHFFST